MTSWTIRNAVQLLQDTNMARGPRSVEALRGTVVDLLAVIGTLQQFVEYNRDDPDFTNLAYSGDLLAVIEEAPIDAMLATVRATRKQHEVDMIELLAMLRDWFANEVEAGDTALTLWVDKIDAVLVAPL